MRIRRIEVRDFRKLGHLTVEGLTDGLNVLVGDNEAGKSTLLAALRAVLFERHRVGGKAVQAMLPHGQDVRPEISVDFEIGGKAYHLRKAFNQRPEAELSGQGVGKVTGEAVEERLAALLGFQAPNSRGSKPDEHQGVHGLLWVDQGLAHAPLNAGAGHGTLASALESEVGLVLGGERGRHLLAAAEKRRDDFWDKRDTPKPKGSFRAQQEEIACCEAQRDVLLSRLRIHDEKVGVLSAKTDALHRCSRDNRLTAAVTAVDTARTAATRAGQLKATLDELSRARHRADLDRQAASGRVADRGALVAKAEADRARATLTRVQASDTLALLEAAQRGAQQATCRLDAARLVREQADADLAAVDQTLALRKAQQDLARVAQTLADAEAVDAGRSAAVTAAAAIGMTKRDLADLDRLCAERETVQLKRDAASVQIILEPTGATPVTVDGDRVNTGVPLLLSRDAVLDLGGFGRLTVRPGGGVATLAEAVETAGRRLDERLRQLGQATRNEAANLLARKLELEAEAVSHERVFAVLAPRGLDALRAEVLALRAVGGSVVTDPDRPVTDAVRAACHRARLEAAAAEKARGLEAGEAEKLREQAARQAAVLEERAASATREADAALSAVASARLTNEDQRLDQLLAEAERRWTVCDEAEAAARTALDAADPDTAALALRRAEGAEAAIRSDIETLTREKRDLEVELRTIGQEGLGEQLEEAEGRLALLRQQVAAASLEAQASLLLHRTLAAAQRESKDRWLGPVRDRVRPYLKLIQPDSEIVLNQKTFSVEHLVRGGVNEPFESLSVGAREQVAVITRLALADILRASGHPSAIILDDALVNTDEDRLDRMHLVLQKAAETLQVIVLTCRERDFYALGAPIRRL